MQGIFLIIFLAIIAWYWWDTMQSKELAKRAGKRMCDEAKVQFLDDTVEKKKIWVRRNSQGRVVVLGKSVSDVSMDAYRIS